MDIKFDVYLYPENLGALYKDNEIDSNGLEAKVDLNLNEVNGIAVNFKIGRESYTDYVEIKDILASTVQIPFKTSVLKAGNNSFELVATMKNGDVKTSRTYAYQIVKSLENPNAVEADTHYPILIDLINQVSAITANGESGGESSGHTHHNKTVLDGITSSKVNEWNNKADKTHTHSQYLTALPTHNHSYNDLSDKPVIPSTEGLATESYVQEKIAEASLSGGEVDLSAYATKAELNTKADKSHTHNELHSHSNKTVLDGITSSKVNEWNNKSTFNGDYNSLTNKPVIPSTEGLATESYVQEKIAEASLSGGEVDLSEYATKAELNNKSNLDHKHDEYVTESELNQKGYLTEHQDISGKVDKVSGKQLSTNDYTNEEKAKLQSIETNANNYIHPTTHNASMITEDSSHRFVSDAEKTMWNNKSDFDGNYNSLSNLPEIPSIEGLATKEELTLKADVDHTHSEYLTELPTHRHNADEIDGLDIDVDLTDYYTKSQVDEKDQVIDDKLTTLSKKVSGLESGGGNNNVLVDYEVNGFAEIQPTSFDLTTGIFTCDEVTFSGACVIVPEKLDLSKMPKELAIHNNVPVIVKLTDTTFQITFNDAAITYNTSQTIDVSTFKFAKGGIVEIDNLNLYEDGVYELNLHAIRGRIGQTALSLMDENRKIVINDGAIADGKPIMLLTLKTTLTVNKGFYSLSHHCISAYNKNSGSTAGFDFGSVTAPKSFALTQLKAVKIRYSDQFTNGTRLWIRKVV